MFIVLLTTNAMIYLALINYNKDLNNIVSQSINTKAINYQETEASILESDGGQVEYTTQYNTTKKLHIDKVAMELVWQTSAVLAVESYRSVCMSCA